MERGFDTKRKSVEAGKRSRAPTKKRELWEWGSASKLAGKKGLCLFTFTFSRLVYSVFRTN